MKRFKHDLKRIKRIQQDDMPMVAQMDEEDMQEMKKEYILNLKHNKT
jgi:hypothetical protein